MSAVLHSFTGYIPEPELAHRIVGPPASTLSAVQKARARRDALSFRHVAGRSARSTRAEAARWLQECRDAGVLRPVGPAVLAYRQTEGDLTATGVIADISLAAYDGGLVKPHEKTLARTERKMVKYVRSTRIYGNPIALAHRAHAGVSSVLSAHTRRDPDTSFGTADGISHDLWIIPGDDAEELCAGFNDPLYITDGHHRMAAASAVAAEEGRAQACLPSGLFAAEELRVRSFARHVHDARIDINSVIDRLRSEHLLEEVTPSQARPQRRFEFGAQIGGRYYRLRLDPAGASSDVYDSLDVNQLQDLILGPVFGITNPRRDKRLRLEPDHSETARWETDADASFLPFPAAVHDVMAVADSGRTMPPKSTWFQPKLPSGLVIRMLDPD